MESEPDHTETAAVGDVTAKGFGVAGWTLFSRATGLVHVVVAGAILGPTFFANIFQATNMIPNTVWNLMAGSLLTQLIIPLLVAELDEGGLERARRLLRQIVGVTLAGFAAVAIVVVLVSPLIVHLLTFGVPAPLRADARTECWVLLFLVIPQIGLYGIVAAAVAAQNSRGHFALAAAAPAMENLGLIATLVFVSVWFGRDTTNVSNGYLVCLGIGATAAVGLHAALQCFGAARRAAVVAFVQMEPPGVERAAPEDDSRRGHRIARRRLGLHPDRRGRHDSRRRRRRRGRLEFLLPAAGAQREGGRHGAPPATLAPALQQKLVEFRETYDFGVSWSWFVAIPASLTMLLSSKPIAQSIAFGDMREGDGIALLSAAIAGFSLALLFATIWEFAKHACYARHDVRRPLVGCAAIVVVVLVGSPIAVAAWDGPSMLVGLGVIVTLGEWIRSVIVDRAARRGTSAVGPSRLLALARHVGVALITLGPGALLGRAVQDAIGANSHVAAIVGVTIGVATGLVAYIAVQALLNAPELPERLQLGRRRHAGGASS